MKHVHLAMTDEFRVAATVGGVQCAEMVLAPGAHEGGPKNRHAGADQWMYVLSDSGAATVNGAHVDLRAGSLLVIERGERHEIRNTGNTPMKTLNFYSPPAYDSDEEPLPAGEG